MSNGLQITFSNGLETLSLFYKVYSHAPAIKWFNMVKDAIARKSGLISDTSFVVTEQDKTDLIVEINVLINKINVKHNLTVKHIVNDSDLNKLHQDVAEVNGELWDSINDAIHRYEQFKAQRTDNPRLNAYFQFDENVFIPLEESDYLFFKADRDFGDLCMNYTYKGKHWLEVASDDDIEAITDGQLQPEDRIKAQGYMLFRPSHPEPYFKLSHFINKKHKILYIFVNLFFQNHTVSARHAVQSAAKQTFHDPNLLKIVLLWYDLTQTSIVYT